MWARPLELPLARALARAGAISAALVAGLALAAAGMRALPLALGDAPARVTLPFLRAVASVALEAAILVGWPTGWALGAFALCERGEARVLALLGRPAWRSVLDALPLASAFALALALTSLAGGRDASEPGRVAADLVAQGRAECARASGARAVDVPLVGGTWLCFGGESRGSARLVLAPSALGASGAASGDATSGETGALVTASRVAIAPDARELTLDDAWLALAAGTTVHAKRAVFHLPPFVRASALGPALRALLLASSGALAALGAAWLVLVLGSSHDVERSMTRAHALAIGAAGPVVTLALLRALDRAGAPSAAFALLPAASLAATVLAAGLVKALPRFLSAASH